MSDTPSNWLFQGPKAECAPVCDPPECKTTCSILASNKCQPKTLVLQVQTSGRNQENKKSSWKTGPIFVWEGQSTFYEVLASFALFAIFLSDFSEMKRAQ